MKHCVLIPCFNHAIAVAVVARAAREHGPVLIVDDGSTPPVPDQPGCEVLRLECNGGKGAALRAGFARAVELGFTHAITMDADGQHFADDLPKFLEIARIEPGALVVGIRDFRAAGCPTHRRRSNAVSTFWFGVETGLRLADTQCGFRCYPLALTQQLRARSGRYAFELEFMVRAAWIGTPVVALPVHCTYQVESSCRSHFRPVRDLAHITLMNIGLVWQSWTVPRALRAAWSRGEQPSLRTVLCEFFGEHAQDPWRLSLAVGLGLFIGIAPIWGFQIIVTATLAHRLNLNKAIAVLASNISVPPLMPFILYGALALGHWLVTGQALNFSHDQMTQARALDYLGHWVIGSLALGALVGAVGTVATYGLARWIRRQ